MNQKEKLTKRLLSLPKDFTYQEAVSILALFGFQEIRTGKTSGSRVRFAHADGEQFVIHKPHPGNVLKTYAVSELAALVIRRSENVE